MMINKKILSKNNNIEEIEYLIDIELEGLFFSKFCKVKINCKYNKNSGKISITDNIGNAIYAKTKKVINSFIISTILATSTLYGSGINHKNSSNYFADIVKYEKQYNPIIETNQITDIKITNKNIILEDPHNINSNIIKKTVNNSFKYAMTKIFYNELLKSNKDIDIKKLNRIIEDTIKNKISIHINNSLNNNDIPTAIILFKKENKITNYMLNINIPMSENDVNKYKQNKLFKQNFDNMITNIFVHEFTHISGKILAQYYNIDNPGIYTFDESHTIAMQNKYGKNIDISILKHSDIINILTKQLNNNNGQIIYNLIKKLSNEDFFGISTNNRNKLITKIDNYFKKMNENNIYLYAVSNNRGNDIKMLEYDYQIVAHQNLNNINLSKKDLVNTFKDNDMLNIVYNTCNFIYNKAINIQPDKKDEIKSYFLNLFENNYKLPKNIANNLVNKFDNNSFDHIVSR